MSILSHLLKRLKPVKSKKQKPTSCLTDPASGSLMLALEPRYLYDAAGLAAGLEGLSAYNGEPADDPGISDPPADTPEPAAPFDARMEIDSTRSRARSEIVFIDTAVTDFNIILDQLPDTIQAIVLDGTQDALQQMAETLEGMDGLDAIHIISHGGDGYLNLGDHVLDRDNLASYEPALSGWGRALSPAGDIHLYGCNVARGQDGARFVQNLAELTGADVAASTDTTGAANQQGDWDLEYRSGEIQSESLTIGRYESRLSTIDVNTTVDEDDGNMSVTRSLREAVAWANQPGDDIITLGAGTFQLTLGAGLENSCAGGDLDYGDTSGTLTIRGAGVDQTFIDGGDIDRVFHLHPFTRVTFEKLTIQNGRARDDGFSEASLSTAALGGGILIEANAEVTLRNVRVTGNEAVGYLGAGGARGASPGANADGNPGGDGGPSYGGGIYNRGTLYVEPGSDVTGNRAQGGGGGGGGGSHGYVSGYTSNGGRGGDGGDAYGGGIYNAGGATLYSEVPWITGNTAAGGGGGGAGGGGMYSLENSPSIPPSALPYCRALPGNGGSAAISGYGGWGGRGYTVAGSPGWGGGGGGAPGANGGRQSNGGIAGVAGVSGSSEVYGSIIDIYKPVVTGVDVPADGNYAPGQDLDFTVHFHESVSIDTGGGTPYLEINLDTGGVGRAYLVGSVSNATSATFRYTVLDGHSDTDGIVVGGALVANGGLIRDAAGNAANPTLNSIADTTNVWVDGLGPQVTSVTVPIDGTYIAGNRMDFTVNFTENMTIDTAGGSPRLELLIGEVSVYAALDGSVTDQNFANFRYDVEIGDFDADGITVLSLDPNGATIRDALGNDANPVLNNIEDTSAILVDSKNDEPVLTGLGGDTLDYNEGDGARVLDQGGDAALADPDNAFNFNTGYLQVTIPAGRVASEDVLSIRNQGAGSGEIGFDGTTVTYEGNAIGTVAAHENGLSGNPLVIRFTADDATGAAVNALIRNVTYENAETTDPDLNPRTIRFVFNDGDGTNTGGDDTSPNYDVTVNLTRDNDPPVIDNLDGDAITYQEGDGAVFLDVGANAGITDPEGKESFSPGGSLRVSIVSGKVAGEDVLGINTGVNLNDVEIIGNMVKLVGFLDAQAIGTLTSDGRDGRDLVVEFNPGTAWRSHVQTLVRNITYENTDSVDLTPGAREISFVIQDADGTSEGGNDTSPAHVVTVDVAKINDPPVNAVPGAQSINEDESLVFNSAGGNTLSISDTDAFSQNVQADLTVTNGTLTAAAGSGATITNDATGAVTITGTVAQINAALEGLRYQPDPHWNGSETLTLTTNDLGNTGPGAESDTDTVTITVSAGNDLPELDLDASNNAHNNYSTDFNGGGNPVPITDSDTLITDPDDPDLEGATVTLTNRPDGANESLFSTLGGPGTVYNGITIGAYDAGSGVLVLSGTGGRAGYESVLESIRYTNSAPADFTDRSVTLQVNDGDGDSNLAVTTIRVNNGPIVDLDQDDSAGAGGYDFTVTFTEDGGAVNIADTDTTITDVDDTNFNGATITLLNRPNGADETLASSLGASHNGITIGAYDPATGTLTLSGTASAADYQTVIASLQYDNTADAPDTTDREITVRVTDAQDDTGGRATTVVSLVAANDAPLLENLAGDILDYSEGDGTREIDQGSDGALNDPDLAAEFNGGSLSATISAGGDAAEDNLSINHQGSLAGQIGFDGSVVSYGGNRIGTVAAGENGQGANPLIIRFDTADASQAAVNALIRNITYENTDAVNPTQTDRTLRLVFSDADGGSDTSAPRDMTIRVSTVNDNPVAIDDTGATIKDTPTTINVLSNDSDPESHPLSVIAVNTTGTTGLVTNNGNGTVTYDPNGQFNSLASGSSAFDSFQYTLSDGNGKTDTATVTVRIDGDNVAPVANADSGAGFEGSADLAFTTGNVRDNDTDANLDPLTVSGFDTIGTRGLVTHNGDGTFLYNPNGQFNYLAAGESATDTFQYTIEDGRGKTASATVTISLSGGNAAPVAVDDTGTTDENVPILKTDILANDTDPNATDTLTITALDSVGTVGNVALVTVGSDTFVYYDPAGGFENLAVGETAQDQFGYTIMDNHGETASAVVTMTITGTNDAPTAAGNSGTTHENAGFQTENVLDNDTDPDTTDTLHVAGLDTTGTLGRVTDNGNGTFTYDPNGSFDYLAVGRTTTDVFSYTVSDDHGATDTAVVTVTITGRNDAPSAGDERIYTDEDNTRRTENVLSNDTDPDASDSLSVLSWDTSETRGLVAYNGDGTFTYDPAGRFDYLKQGQNTLDYFHYTVSDDHGGTDTATVTVSISGVNDPPVAGDDSGQTNEDTAMTTENVLANDTDRDDAHPDLAITAIQTADTIGSVRDNRDGTFTYDPAGQFESLAAGESATDSFRYTLSDSHGAVDTATVTVTVTGVNDGPTATDDDESTDENTTVRLENLLANDTDPDTADTLHVHSLDTSGTTGMVMDHGDGTFTYDPAGRFDYLAAGETAVDRFSYTIQDSHGADSHARVTVTIQGMNDAPEATGDTAQTDEDTAIAVADVRLNDMDPDATDTIQVTGLDTRDTVGAVVDNRDGTFTYDPAGRFDHLAHGATATDGFQYTISDGHGGTDTATVTLTVTGVNDAPQGGDDQVVTDEDNPLTLHVLQNVHDMDGDALTIQKVSAPRNGRAVINPDNTITYTPQADYHGPDSFICNISDGHGGQCTARVDVEVKSVPDVGTPKQSPSVRESRTLMGHKPDLRPMIRPDIPSLGTAGANQTGLPLGDSGTGPTDPRYDAHYNEGGGTNPGMAAPPPEAPGSPAPAPETPTGPVSGDPRVRSGQGTEKEGGTPNPEDETRPDETAESEKKDTKALGQPERTEKSGNFSSRIRHASDQRFHAGCRDLMKTVSDFVSGQSADASRLS